LQAAYQKIMPDVQNPLSKGKGGKINSADEKVSVAGL
jgi:hypothetical protein